MICIPCMPFISSLNNCVTIRCCLTSGCPLNNGDAIWIAYMDPHPPLCKKETMSHTEQPESTHDNPTMYQKYLEPSILLLAVGWRASHVWHVRQQCSLGTAVARVCQRTVLAKNKVGKRTSQGKSSVLTGDDGRIVTELRGTSSL